MDYSESKILPNNDLPPLRPFVGVVLVEVVVVEPLPLEGRAGRAGVDEVEPDVLGLVVPELDVVEPEVLELEVPEPEVSELDVVESDVLVEGRVDAPGRDEGREDPEVLPGRAGAAGRAEETGRAGDED